MKNLKMLVTGAALVAVAFGASAGMADSSRCDGGNGGGGIKVYNEGDPVGRSGWAAVCSDGSTVPIAGHVEIGGDLNGGESGWLTVDGDESNEDYASCADGFVHGEFDSSGKNEWQSGPNGDHEDTNPNKPGKQRAPKKSIDKVATDLNDDCH